jgi:hypothetical protein
MCIALSIVIIAEMHQLHGSLSVQWSMSYLPLHFLSGTMSYMLNEAHFICLRVIIVQYEV